MSHPYASAAEFRQNCHACFNQHVDAGLALHPDANPSYLCVRTAESHDYDVLKGFSADIGEIVEKNHNGNLLTFVKLNEPLVAGLYTLDWLEIAAPKTDYPTGPQMLVYQEDGLIQAVKHYTDSRQTFALRFQAKSAAELVL